MFFRLWHVNFGLPHSFYADEPEIVEFSIKYAFELKNIVLENNWYKLIPVSYVYGMFPAYLLTIFTLSFSKIANILHYSFDKESIYIYLRIINGLLSMFLIPTVSYLYYKMFKDKVGSVISFFLLAFNWKLIVHAHYVNADIFITILLVFSYLTLFLYQEKNRDTLYTLLTGIFFGLAVGTKITALITLPLYWYIFLRKKDVRGLVAFTFVIFGVFMISNPFSIIFVNDFVFRVYSMLFKEAGLVFDSVNLNPLKYLIGLSWISTFPVFLFFIFGVYKLLKPILTGNISKDTKSRFLIFNIFLLGNVLFYLVFYSIQSRRVDRWLLPILPVVILYASYGISILYRGLSTDLKKKTVILGYRVLGVSLLFFTFCYYMFFPVALLTQFQRNTPKSASYIWMKENVDIQNPTYRTLAYTEEGLDPLNKLPYASVYQFNVYDSKDASLFFPQDPYLYKYVILSSRPMENFKRVPVRERYVEYAKRWESFENVVTNTQDFSLIKTFKLSTPNLIPLSNVYIYENNTF